MLLPTPTSTQKLPRWAPAVAKLAIPPDAKEAATIALGCLRHLSCLASVAKHGPQDDASLAKYGAPHLEALDVLVRRAAGESRRAGEKVRKYAADYLCAKTTYHGLPGSIMATAHEAAVDEAAGAVVLASRGQWDKLRERLTVANWRELESAVVKEAAAVPRQTTANDKPHRKRRTKPMAEREVTPRQAEVVHVVAECKANFAEAGRRLGIDRKTVKETYDAAMAKVGSKANTRHITKRLKSDRRGQADVAEGDDRRL